MGWLTRWALLGLHLSHGGPPLVRYDISLCRLTDSPTSIPYLQEAEGESFSNDLPCGIDSNNVDQTLAVCWAQRVQG